MKSPCHDEFSFGCAVGLLSISLETLIIMGSMVKVSNNVRLFAARRFALGVRSCLQCNDSIGVAVYCGSVLDHLLRLAARLIWIRKRSSLHAARKLRITFGYRVM